MTSKEALDNLRFGALMLHNIDYIIRTNNECDIIEKDLEVLEQLEDIEEELEIDLITLSKVLRQKYVFNKEKVKVDLLSLFVDIEANKLYMYGYIRNTFEDVRLYAKDYGKTWMLTKEEWLEEHDR